MNLIRKLIQKFTKEKSNLPEVVTTRDLVKYMKEERIMFVPKYDDKKVKDFDISMSH